MDPPLNPSILCQRLLLVKDISNYVIRRCFLQHLVILELMHGALKTGQQL